MITLAYQNLNHSPFDSIRHEGQQGEYWLARELMPLLGYKQWRQFSDAIERAIISQQNSGNEVTAHFLRLTAKSQGRPKEDYQLSRYACYLVAMNGDPRKTEIAAAQNYFVVKTREAETAIPSQNAIPNIPILPPAQQLAMATNALEKLGVDLTNPRYAQGLRDWSLNLLGITASPGSTAERWVGVAERAEELGFGRIGADLSKRVMLGRWVSNQNPTLTRRREKRLCNGEDRSIWVYLVCDELDDVIADFFGAA